MISKNQPVKSSGVNQRVMSRTHDTSTVGKVDFENPTNATDPTNGSIHTKGGLGVEKDAHIGGILKVQGKEISGANSGDVTIGAVGTDPNTKGMSLDGQEIKLQPASHEFPGVISILAQAIKGVKTFVDDVIVQGFLLRSNATGITAFAGGGQASAAQLLKEFNRVTTVASDNDSVKLPSGKAGMSVIVVNDGAKNLAIFPKNGEQIDSFPVNGELTLPPSTKTAHFVCVVDQVWRSIRGGGGGGSSLGPIVTKNASGPLTLADKCVLIDASAGSIVLTMPPWTLEHEIVFFRIDNVEANTVTVQCAGADKILGKLGEVTNIKIPYQGGIGKLAGIIAGKWGSLS